MNVTALNSGSTWKAAPGYQTLVIDDGAVRFECPSDWFFAATPRCVCVSDRRPPLERTLLALSWRRLPHEATILSLPHLMTELAGAGIRPGAERSQVIRVLRPPLELAWTELRFVDHVKQRAAGTRLCLARSGCTQALAVFDFWLEDSLSLFGVWNAFLKTVVVGETIDNLPYGRRRERWG